MILSLSENIRSFRKQRKITQEKLAEALGVTVGAVYKWESGQSQPELKLVVEMADFFDTSVDVLLGYRIRDNRLDAALERLNSYCQTLDPAALTEAEKTLGKYPHSFRAVYSCAKIYLAFGTLHHDRGQLERALELLEQSRVLLPQNDDPRINEATICGDLSIGLLQLGMHEKSLELLKRNNAGGIFSSQIGSYLAIYMDRPEDAAPFLSEALLDVIATLLTTILSYVFIFRSRSDWDSALAITAWGIDFLTGLKTETKPDVLEKTHAEMLALLAYVQAKAGMRRQSHDSLRQAGVLALRFDSMPDYSLKAMRFIDQMDQAMVFDILGASASGSITNLIDLLDDQALAEQWKEILDAGR